MDILGFKPPYDQILFGTFTGNNTLIRWFEELNKSYGVEGNAKILYKVHGKDKT
jgi:hypothetical protein